MTPHLILAAELPVSLDEFILKALAWSEQFNLVAYYNPNQIAYPYDGFKHFLAVTNNAPLALSDSDTFESLRKEIQKEDTFLCGYLSYDLKNQVEKLDSNNPDFLDFPAILFFQPSIRIEFVENDIFISGSDLNIREIITEISGTPTQAAKNATGIQVQQRVSKEEYTLAVDKIKRRIIDGDVYEMNYCIEFFAENVRIQPLSLYLALIKESPTPFSGYLKFKDNYLLCASPERFLKKEGSKLISQPIKGTIKRDNDPETDEALRLQLRYDEKELAENMMIVDLVRNDLSRSCAIGSVKVEEMFGIYGFRQVWQMISTVTGNLKPEKNLVDALIGAFPMGSMTGAPKISAMQIIEELEVTKRGLYSGAFGYITPEQDCDFNVVIRSIQYNSNTGYLSFMVGSAITYDSDAEKEYEECLLKAQAMLKVLS